MAISKEGYGSEEGRVRVRIGIGIEDEYQIESVAGVRLPDAVCISQRRFWGNGSHVACVPR